MIELKKKLNKVVCIEPNNIVMSKSTYIFFFSSRRRHTRLQGDWSSDVCSSDPYAVGASLAEINPLVTTPDGSVQALDAKIVIDDNELERRPDIADRKSVV